uniref:Putative cytoskeletal regulator flightless-i n=1 Tax=Corethrella appendiculata TaxID=1370023 RepID=U5EL25_9DIPT
MEASYTSDSSDSDSRELKTLSLTHGNGKIFDYEMKNLLKTKRDYCDIETIILHHNALISMPITICKFNNLQTLDMSSNNLTILPDEIIKCPLSTLNLKNNKLNNNSLPKSLISISGGSLKEINLSGNNFEYFPEQLIELKSLKYLYLGGNQITNISKDIGKLQSLQLLSLGSNKIVDVPEAVGFLNGLHALVLSDNMIESLPSSIAKLKNLKSLLLHKNQLKTLPREIITLRNLTELSLRENPLIVRFVMDMSLNPSSLLELAARTVKCSEIKYGPEELPRSLIEYLSTANCCVNPQCTGVFFDNRVEHVKFVDFCGKYRIPLLQYLCSSKCIVDAGTSSESIHSQHSGYMMRKVLLG